MLIMQTLIIRDADLNIIDEIEIEPGQEITRADVRAILRAHSNAHAIERVSTIERRPS
jgi:hypothetical protein